MIAFSLISPERVLLERPVSMAVLPGIEGDMGILPNHSPLITLLRPGTITLYDQEEITMKMFVEGGFAEVTPETCTVLVTAGIPVDRLNKDTLDIEIQTLLDNKAHSSTPEEQKKIDKNLTIARAKLMELLSH